MKNLVTVLTLATLFLAIAAGTLLQVRVAVGADLPRPESPLERALERSIPTERMLFWAITAVEMRAEDPIGWAMVRAGGDREESEAWAMTTRQRVFMRLYGHPFAESAR